MKQFLLWLIAIIVLSSFVSAVCSTVYSDYTHYEDGDNIVINGSLFPPNSMVNGTDLVLWGWTLGLGSNNQFEYSNSHNYNIGGTYALSIGIDDLVVDMQVYYNLPIKTGNCTDIAFYDDGQLGGSTSTQATMVLEQSTDIGDSAIGFSQAVSETNYMWYDSAGTHVSTIGRVTEEWIRMKICKFGSYQEFYINGTLIGNDTSATYGSFKQIRFASHRKQFFVDDIQLYDDVSCPQEAASGVIAVTLNTPDLRIQNNYTNDTIFHYTPVSAAGALDNCSIYTNESGSWAFRGIDISPVNNTDNGITPDTATSDVEGYVKWNVECCGSEDTCFFASSNRTIIIDTITPTITLNANNSFTTGNMSHYNPYLDYFELNITFSDETDLFGALINITKGGITYFNYTNISITGKKLNFTKNFSISSWTNGVYQIELSASDTHTAKTIKDYDVSTFLNEMTFKTTEKNIISVKALGAISSFNDKKADRYSFGFNYLTSPSERVFEIESSNTLYYLPDSKYTAHFVVWNSKEKKGNWIDFEGIGTNYIVKRTSDTKYTITFSGISEKEIIFNSIGGLNIKYENYSWYRGDYTNTFTDIVATESVQTFKFNLSKNPKYIKNLNATLTYNGVERALTTTNGSTFTLFQSSFTVPTVNGNYNFTWDIIVNQTDGKQFDFQVNSSQTIQKAQLNISFYDEENYTSIAEDLKVYFTLEQTLEKTATNGFLSVGNLTLGEYYIEAEGTNYPKRGIFYTIVNETKKINMFLVFDKNENDDIDFYVKSTNLENIENARMTLFRKYNNSYVTVAQGETDYAGQLRLFLDQQNEYRITLFHPSYTEKTIDLKPLLLAYTITWDLAIPSLYENVYEGIRYSIYPKTRVLNKTGAWQDITFSIYAGDSSLEYFGVIITDTNLTCNPASCITNVSGSPAGGSATVQIKLNQTDAFKVHFFFKRSGWETQYVNQRWYEVVFLMFAGKTAITIFENLKDVLGGEDAYGMKAVFAAVGTTAIIIVGSQMGIIGIGLLAMAIIGTVFFMFMGFIPLMVGGITLVVGVALFIVFGRDE